MVKSVNTTLGGYVKVTPQLLRLYIGGQLEIKNPTLGYHYRGEIESIKVTHVDGESIVLVKFTWRAEYKGYPHKSKPRWIFDTLRPFLATTKAYIVADAGDGKISLSYADIDETATFYPGTDSNILHRSEVRDY